MAEEQKGWRRAKTAIAFILGQGPRRATGGGHYCREERRGGRRERRERAKENPTWGPSPSNGLSKGRKTAPVWKVKNVSQSS